MVSWLFVSFSFSRSIIDYWYSILFDNILVKIWSDPLWLWSHYSLRIHKVRSADYLSQSTRNPCSWTDGHTCVGEGWGGRGRSISLYVLFLRSEEHTALNFCICFCRILINLLFSSIVLLLIWICSFSIAISLSWLTFSVINFSLNCWISSSYSYRLILYTLWYIHVLLSCIVESDLNNWSVYSVALHILVISSHNGLLDPSVPSVLSILLSIRIMLYFFLVHQFLLIVLILYKFLLFYFIVLFIALSFTFLFI